MKHSLLTATLLMAISATGLLAQANPDVIVGDLPNFANYSAQGGIDAFSVATTSCNVGNANLSWIANTPAHPVISQHAFRLSNGRFEMIGQSWLKHGFTALTNSLCDPCSGMGGSVLGVGCSDPYGAGLNGSQGGLGPKFEVNAFTGVFSYPFSNPNGSTGNSIFKRLQIATSDLGVPGARYFIESMYVAADDAAAGNHYNNASHRECSFTGGPSNYNGSFLGTPTVREQPGIMAWANIDSDVQLDSFDAPNDGRFWVGFLHTDNGDGTHTWEFAVHNLNSDRSGRGFRVDLPAGATASNLGFHDVAYHSGEPFAGTDWTSSISGGQTVWTTQTFAQNSDANALRWGTLYNFRFTCDMAPDSTTGVIAEIELFKPGTGGNFVPVNLLPPAQFNVVSGSNQTVGIGEAFPQDLEVQLLTATGLPLVGVPVTFLKVGGSGNVTFPSGNTANTDSLGFASVAIVASATAAGALAIEASAGDDAEIFDLYIRRLSSNWIPGAGILIFSMLHGDAGVPLSLAINDGSFQTLQTSFGPLYTSILNPDASFYAESGDLGAGYAAYNPALVTSSTGAATVVYQGLQSLAGSGINLNHQAYALTFNNGQLDVWLSNLVNRTY
ncbi:MAG: hypothetical protein V3W41_15315 [Planctomycetota bacterium]